jgi:threonyl-tRNA synthetase
MNDDQLHAMRHSAEHVLTMAMLRLFGKDNIIMAMGPATEEGFYFDFDSPKDFKISEDQFPKVVDEMKKIIKEDLPFVHEELTGREARKLFHDNPYKLEWIDEIDKRGEKASIYRTGDFVDLCSGPHVASSGKIGAVALLSIAGAYWHGSEKNKMLTRIYGTSFPTNKELSNYLTMLTEAKKRDHRVLGPQLDLFVINDDIGKGLPLLTPKGTIIRNEILAYERELEREAGFTEVWTPHIAKNNVYKRTGHWDHYRDVMYAPFGIDNETYVLKPMNCPHHYMIYASRPRSYRDLPMRLSEPGTCYRYEKSGELGGLIRVRALTIDDSHILMQEGQIHEEFDRCIAMVKKMFAAFGLSDFWVRLSLNDPSDAVKYITDPKVWEKAGETLETIVKDNNLTYKRSRGEASFYGPKIDFMVKDAIGREWQMSTLQLDLFMAKRLGLTYIDSDGKEKHPVILHRGLTGSLERTIGILIEHYSGAFPLWLAPVQVVIIPIAERHNEAAKKAEELLKAQGVRVEVDTRNQSMQGKIRDHSLQKVPYLGIIGDREARSDGISVRTRKGEDLKSMSLESFSDRLRNEIEKKL